MPRLYGNQSLSRNTMQGIIYPTDPFGDMRVVQRNTQLDLKSTFGISALRDQVTTESSGTVSFTGSEYLLSTTTLDLSRVILQSKQRGRYQSGTGAEAAIGIRIPSSFSETQFVRFGLFDGSDGYFYQYDNTNKLSVNVVHSNTITQVVQSNFNIDKLDGKGPSGFILDMSRGIVFRILYTWNGFGSVVFLTTMTDSDGSQCIIPIHQIAFSGEPGCATPNLPLRVDVNNNGTASACNVYVCGRQYTTIGVFNPPQRITSCLYENGSGLNLSSSTFTPIMAIRKKTGFSGTHVLMRGIDFLTNSRDAYFRIILNPSTITGGTWGAPPHTDSTETALELSNPTSFTGGITMLMGVLDSTLYNTVTENGILITDNDVLLVSAKGLTGTSSVTLSIIRFTEEW